MRRLLDRQIGRARAFEDAVGERRSTPKPSRGRMTLIHHPPLQVQREWIDGSWRAAISFRRPNIIVAKEDESLRRPSPGTNRASCVACVQHSTQIATASEHSLRRMTHFPGQLTPYVVRRPTRGRCE